MRWRTWICKDPSVRYRVRLGVYWSVCGCKTWQLGPLVICRCGDRCIAHRLRRLSTRITR